MKKNKVVLIDGNALMYKAFYASSFLLEKGEGFDDYGRPINALRTFATMIFNLIERFDESNMIIAFDEKGLVTYRTKHDFYKAGRSKMPDDLISQKLLIIEMLNLAGIKHISSSVLEADDIIGILSKKFSSEGIFVEIITSDKDLLQLVDFNVNVFISKTGVSEMLKYTFDNFRELFFGLLPSQVVDLKGIMGDPSDNLSGIKGIGEKGAVKLLLEYGNIDEIIYNKKNLSQSLQNKINYGQEMGFLCRDIATIITNGNIEIEFDTLKIFIVDREKFLYFLREHSIHHLANKLEKKWL